MLDLLKMLTADERGNAAIEYALISGLICLVIVGAVYLVGQRLRGAFGCIA